MKEQLFVSGRSNHLIDPVLNVWHWEIPVYLFLGGLAAGLLFFAALYYINGKEKEMPTTIKWAPILAPITIIQELVALFLDLKFQTPFFYPYLFYYVSCNRLSSFI